MPKTGHGVRTYIYNSHMKYLLGTGVSGKRKLKKTGIFIVFIQIETFISLIKSSSEGVAHMGLSEGVGQVIGVVTAFFRK